MTRPTTSAGGPLQGLRILDLTAVVMGPYATQTLGDLGADVIKVEPPAGDNLRAVGPMRNPGMGALSLHLNRNKRSVVLDLKRPEGRDACLKLAETCDALIYNTRPKAMARLGLDYAAVSARNPRIVYLGCIGFGEDGPYAGKPAYDDLIQGAVALPTLYAAQSGGDPRYAPVTLADRAVGLQSAIALLAAVLHAQRTGCGQAVEVPMFEALAQFVMGDHLGGQSFEPPAGPMGYARLLAPHRKPYRTADGHLSVLIYNDKHWQAFFDVIGRPDLKTSPMFSNHTARAAHIGEVYAFVAEVMATRSSEDWYAALQAADVPVGRLHTVESLKDDPHLRAVGFFPEMEHPSEGTIRTTAPVGHYGATPPAIRRHAPRLGEHSAEVLREAGYSQDEVQALIDGRITAQANAPLTSEVPAA
ncbi:CoA transferase [Xylophilus sp. GOD-11R]|uniref:CaiB/BaiF CoA transferase family protein n=1 Tax=Xylophilus sp. GOD-11R TaxID=3089814 RepID=UPI00298C2381|nr:CoA transferase [Xylophilus sp. GOD-11R]WPB55548.1 CoA transferase [Xylophilus sp. GOD-11R]